MWHQYLFLDFSKAFDCVDHTILIRKLKCYNVFGPSLKLLSSFLNNRKQFTAFNSTVSDLSKITVGVPQGSVLAPTLFQIYVNDLLFLPLSAKAHAYADDTVFISEHNNIQSLEHCCNIDLQLTSKWCLVNRMTINVKKSHFLMFGYGSSGCDLSLKVNGNKLKREKHSKLLGFTLCEDLKWNTHIDQILKKVVTNVNLLQLCRPYLTRDSSRTFHYQFINCHLIYGIYIYFNLSPNCLTNNLY